jgi:hypothetical protein
VLEKHSFSVEKVEAKHLWRLFALLDILHGKHLLFSFVGREKGRIYLYFFESFL